MPMKKTGCGYMTSQEWQMICRISKQQDRAAKAKADSTTRDKQGAATVPCCLHRLSKGTNNQRAQKKPSD